MELFNTNQFDSIRAIFFDFDETMYSSDNILEYYVKFVKQTILDLSNYDSLRADEIIKEYGFDQPSENRVSFGKTCEQFGIKEADWNAYKIDHFFEVDYGNAQIVDNSLYQRIAEKMPIFIVSNEIYENVLYKADKLGIDLSSFSAILAPRKANPIMISKKDEIQKTLDELGIEYKDALVIGDRFKVDVKPMLDLGGCGVQVKNVKEVEDVLKNIIENSN
mgnify:CR=1 FL=1